MSKYISILFIFVVLFISACSTTTNTFPFVDEALPEMALVEENAEPNPNRIEVQQQDIGWVVTPIYNNIPMCTIYQKDNPSDKTLFFSPESQDGNCRDLPDDVGFIYMKGVSYIVLGTVENGIEWVEIDTIYR